MRRMPQQYANPHVRRERDPRAARRQVLLVGCLVLAGGSSSPCGSRFEAVDYGYEAEALRREREQLLDEQRRLLLALEESSSPAQLEAAAREMGMQPARAAQIETASAREQRAEPGVFVGTATAGGVRAP